jgi:hypothetical protein
MTQKILKGNKLIAKYMGFEYNGTDSFGNDNYRIPEVYRKFFHCSHFDNLHFDRSWDWLMPVVEKIENYEEDRYSVNFVIDNCQSEITIYHTSFQHPIETFSAIEGEKIKSTYLVCIEFIKWYNTPNQ